MNIGYARTSTLDQKASIEAQRRDLEGAGCQKVFAEQVSSVDTVARERLTEALEYLREGDVLVVTKIDRLARSMRHLMEVLDHIEKRKAFLRILGSPIDTTTPSGKLMLNVLGAVAEFEREVMLERQREGIAKAKASGKYKGRKPAPVAKVAEVHRLHTEGVGPSEIARRIGIGRATVYRLLERAPERVPEAG
jgi:DNA invertase Pin-like site-specific DNA recombinase